MKKLIAIFILALLYSSVFAQIGYKNKLEPVNGVEIYYKIVHANYFDKESPAQIRIKLKNVNDYDVNVKFEIEYSTDMIKRYSSGGIEICIPNKISKAGKISGLTFELNTNNIEIFSTEDADWQFIRFDVEQIDDCKVLNN